jgi:ATP-dependent protease ClpP protease subunit
MKDFYKFQCNSEADPATAELLIFDVIGEYDFLGEVGAKQFAASLNALPKSVKRLDIHINSPGGSLTEAQAIYSRLADHASQKNVYIDGIAASAASIVAMVGHKVYIRSNANLMIHLPSGLSIGNANDMRTMAAALDSMTEGMINVYNKKTGMSREDIRALLTAETWMDADSAVAKGFADEVRGVVKAAASIGNNRVIFNGTEFNLSRFHNIPAFSATTEGVTTMAEQTQDPPAPKPTAAAPTTETPTPPPKPPDPKPPPKAEDIVSQERQRVAALMELDRPATHALITAAIKDGRTVTDIAGECMKEMDKASGQVARRADASALDRIPPSDGGTTAGENDFGKRIDAAVQQKLKQRRSPVMLNGRN